MSNTRSVRILFIGLTLSSLGFISADANAEIIIPFIPADKVTVNIDSNVTFDPTSSLYTYVYELTSAVTSEQDVSLLTYLRFLLLSHII